MAEKMKAYRIYFSNGKDVRIEADGHEVTKEGHLELFNYKGEFFIETVYIVNANLWTIIDIALGDEDE